MSDADASLGAGPKSGVMPGLQAAALTIHAFIDVVLIGMQSAAQLRVSRELQREAFIGCHALLGDRCGLMPTRRVGRE